MTASPHPEENNLDHTKPTRGVDHLTAHASLTIIRSQTRRNLGGFIHQNH